MQEKVIQTLPAEGETEAATTNNDEYNGEKVVKSEAEWKKDLTPEQFYVLRDKGTKRAFAGEYTDNHETGDYYCAAADRISVTFSTTDRNRPDCAIV